MITTKFKLCMNLSNMHSFSDNNVLPQTTFKILILPLFEQPIRTLAMQANAGRCAYNHACESLHSGKKLNELCCMISMKIRMRPRYKLEMLCIEIGMEIHAIYSFPVFCRIYYWIFDKCLVFMHLFHLKPSRIQLNEMNVNKGDCGIKTRD